MDLKKYLGTQESQTAFAKRLGLTQGAVSQWLRKGIPANRVLPVEKATGGVVTRHEMRPDLYPKETDVAA